MARHRFHAELVGLLERASQPLYVLDDALTIIYLNEACRNWLGTDAEELLGRKCVYHSGNELTGPDRAAAGLCPPPAVLEGREVSADVAKPSGEAALFRRARFVPLRRPDDEIVCIVALVDAQDRTEKTPAAVPSQGDESQELHEHLQRFGQQTTLHYGLERVVGLSPAIRRARAQAEVAVATRASIVLLGPPGSGRRHLAEVIHYSGPAESRGGLLPLECGLLDAELIQATLRLRGRRKKRRHPAALRGRSTLRREPDRAGLDPIGGQLPMARNFDRRRAVGRPLAKGTLPRGPGGNAQHDHH